MTSRQDILKTASDLTSTDRNQTYGEPRENLDIAGRLKEVLRQGIDYNAQRDISPAELEALDLLMTKVSRIICGKLHMDNYVDAAAYIAIAGEVAEYYVTEELPPTEGAFGLEEQMANLTGAINPAFNTPVSVKERHTYPGFSERLRRLKDKPNTSDTGDVGI